MGSKRFTKTYQLSVTVMDARSSVLEQRKYELSPSSWGNPWSERQGKHTDHRACSRRPLKLKMSEWLFILLMEGGSCICCARKIFLHESPRSDNKMVLLRNKVFTEQSLNHNSGLYWGEKVWKRERPKIISFSGKVCVVRIQDSMKPHCK